MISTRPLGLALVVILGACGDNTRSEAPVRDVISRSAPAPVANCPGGGTIVFSGIDANGNGVLDDLEISDSSVVCSVAGAAAVMRLVDEPAGAHCADGGTAIETGHDTNANGALDDAEVEHVEYACGDVLLTRTVDEPKGLNCVAGGVALLAGRDRDHDGVLADDEVESKHYACGDVFEGDVTITSAATVAQYSQIVAITGRLTVSLVGDGIGLPRLIHVGSDLTFTASATEPLSLPALVDVGGTVRVGGGAPALPVLRHVGALDLTSSHLHDLGAFAALRQIDRTVMLSSSQLVDAELHLASVGDVTVTNNAQLAGLTLAATGPIGRLYVDSNAKLASVGVTAGPTIGIVTLSRDAQLAHVAVAVERIDQLFLNQSPNVTDVAITTSHVTGDLDLYDVQTPFTLALTSVNNVIDVGGLTISGPLKTFTTTAGIESRGQITFDKTQLVTIDHIVAARGGNAGGLRLSNNAQLASVAPLSLEGSLQVINNAQLRTIDFLDQDDLFGGLQVSDNPVLVSAPSLAKLHQIASSTTITNNPQLASVFGPLLESAGFLVEIANNAQLASLQLPNLTGPMYQFDVSYNAVLQQLELPRLRSIQTLTVHSNAQLHHIDFTAFTASAEVTISANPHLPTCEVTALFSHVGGTHMQSGNDDSATCP